MAHGCITCVICGGSCPLCRTCGCNSPCFPVSEPYFIEPFIQQDGNTDVIFESEVLVLEETFHICNCEYCLYNEY